MKKIIALLLVLVMVLSMTACAKTEKKVVVASKPFAESYIIAEMLVYLIERDTDLTVEYKEGIGGGHANIQPAMEKGEIDLYPEYTGTGWLSVLGKELVSDPMELYAMTKEAYKTDFNFVWTGLYGFNNTYTMAVTADAAQTYGLETFSDLAAVSSELNFGAEYDFFEREDGYPGLSSVYGFEFADIKEMDIGLKYKAIGDGAVDVINAFSTDGLLKEYNLKVLFDDQFYFPAYHGATVVRQEVLDQYPELLGILEKLTGAISDDEMSGLNLKVERDNESPKEVARQFIEDKGL
ncbi:MULTISPECIES: glycine betaine ABC transporter substrate-binding protein [unclassified Fusibacter]|uniref:glycine betaine ABC transporter substrate-binding protein n=1 Tax=unclassified Fusibacter TaxID=2624464 RepID=UPI00149520A7|nr:MULTISPECIES: glycine betaine ABC transporter substrate-binding protein [unclassified Fusibacter]MCK8059971.1 glycine/betaine ABC transporter substrate-binding protein [Fusibacter sp. A2]